MPLLSLHLGTNKRVSNYSVYFWRDNEILASFNSASLSKKEKENIAPVAKKLIMLVALVMCEPICASLIHLGTSDVTEKNKVRHRHQPA